MPDCTDTVTYSKLSIVIWHDAIAIAIALASFCHLSLSFYFPLYHSV